MAARVDISSELNVIAIEPYGDAVKTAVHDAIQKVNSGGGESKNDGPRKIDRLFDAIKADGSSEIIVLANDILAACIPGIAVEELDPMNVNLLRFTWENRYGDSDTGEFNGNPTNRIACVDYVEIPTGVTRETISMTGVASTYYDYVYYYDSSHQYLGVTPWQQTGLESTYIFPGAKYVRLGFRRSDNDLITYNTIYKCVISFFTNPDESVYDMTDRTWENRYGDDGTGQFSGDPTNRLVCEDYIPVSSGSTQISLALFALDAEYDMYMYFYDVNKQYLGATDWISTTSSGQIMQNAAYIRFGFRRHNDVNLSGQDVRSCSAIFS